MNQSAHLNRVFARMRSRRQRWITPWLVLLLLVHQLALTQHLCLMDTPAMPATEQMASAHCEMTELQADAAVLEHLACSLHCNNLPKIAKDPISLQVPALLPAPLPSVADAPAALAHSPWTRPENAAAGYRRPLQDHPILLI